MSKITKAAMIVILGVLVLTGFSTDHHAVKTTPSSVNASLDYSNFIQYMQ